MLNKEYIFADDRDFLSCHASTVLPLNDGDVLAAWFGGTEEGKGDVAIWCSRRHDGHWSRPVNLTGEQDLPHFNPVLFYNSDGRILLVYKTGWHIPDWISMVMFSDDGGWTWSETKELVQADDTGGRGPVKNKVIVASNGVLLAPASIENELWDAFVDISADGGNSWVKSGPVPIERDKMLTKGVIQPTLWESSPGHVHMLLRSTEGWIYRSDSVDCGHTWGAAYKISLPNNNSGIDLQQLSNGDLLLVYNPISESWGPRTPLVLDISQDNGASWKRLHVLEDEEGEYSYPAIARDGNNVHVSYTWKRERIAYHYFTEESLLGTLNSL